MWLARCKTHSKSESCAKIISFVIVYCFLQTSGCLADDITDYLKPQLNEALRKVTFLTNESTEKFRNVKISIDHVLEDLANIVNYQRDKLNEIVQDAQDNARASGISIDSCLDQQRAGLQQVTINSLDDCANDANLQVITSKIKHLKQLRTSLWKSIEKCKSENPSNDEVKSCLQDIINNTEKQVSTYKVEISQALENYLAAANTCGRNVGDNIGFHLDTIRKTFDICVKTCPLANDVIKQLNPLLHGAFTDVTDNLSDGKEILRQVYRGIQETIENLTEKLATELCNLEDTVKRAEEDAIISNENIRNCLRQEKLSRDNFRKPKTDQCWHTPEILTLQETLLEVYQMYTILAEAPTMCKQLGCDLEEIRSCIEHTITHVHNKLEITMNAIHSLHVHAEESSKKCVNESLSDIYFNVKKVYRDFRNCTKGCEPVDDVVEEVKPRLMILSKEVATDLSQNEERFHITKTLIEDTISSLTQHIQKRKNDLIQTAKQVQKESQASGKGIKACIDQYEGSLAAVLSNSTLTPCLTHSGLNKVSSKIDVIRTLLPTLGHAIDQCKEQSCGEDETRICLENIREEGSKRLEYTVQSIDTLLPVASSRAKNCTLDTTTALMNQIDKIKDDLMQCVDRCTPADAIVNNLRPSLITTLQEISNVITESTSRIKQTRRNIDELITDIDNNLVLNEAVLKENVEDVVENYKISGQNIDDCVNQMQENLKVLPRSNREVCRQTSNRILDALTDKITAIEKLDALLISAPDMCKKRNCNLGIIKKCIEEIIQGVTDQIEKTRRDVKSTLLATQSEAGKCVNAAADDLTARINVISKIFRQCTNGCESADYVIQELQPKIDTSSIDISNLINESNDKLEQTEQSISKLISYYTKLLERQKTKLNNNVEKVRSVTKASGQDIRTCLEQEEYSVSRLRHRSVDQCRNIRLLSRIKEDLADLANAQINEKNAAGKCRQESCTIDEAKSCIEKILQDSARKVNKAKENLKIGLPYAQGNISKCIRDTAIDLNAQIDQITRTLVTCTNQQCASKEKVSKEVGAYLQSSFSKVTDVATKIKGEIGVAEFEVDHTISNFNKTINKDLNDLSKLTRQIKNSASESDIDVKKCTTQAQNKIDKLNRKSLLTCDSSAEFESLKRSSEQVESLETVADHVVEVCRKKMCALNDVVNCIKFAVLDVRDKVVALQRQTEENLFIITYSAKKCATSVVTSLNNEIQKIRNDLIACVSF